MQLSRSVKLTRVKMFLEVAKLVACGPKLLVTAGREGNNAEKKREELLELLAALSNTDRTLYKDLLRSHRSVIADVMRLSPEKASSLQHSLRMTIGMRRKLSTACIKLFGFTFLPGEKKQWEFERDVCRAFANDKLERGSMMLLKSTKDPAPRPCYYAKITNILEYLESEVKKAMSDEFEDPDCMANILSPKYGGWLWVTVGGDKGGQTTKITAVLGGGREPLVLGMFYGTDCSANLLRFFGDWTRQLRELDSIGLMVRLENGSASHFPVHLLLNGDMQFQCEVLGHSGSASKLPSLYRKIDRDHLQKCHR